MARVSGLALTLGLLMLGPLILGSLGCAAVDGEGGSFPAGAPRSPLTRATPHRADAARAIPSLHSLTTPQLQALVVGDLVAQPMVQQLHGRRYSGGVSHLLVHASADVVMRELNDPQGMQQVLPRTQRATLINARAGVREVELLQGNDWVQATYTVTLKDQPRGDSQEQRVTFALDHRKPHDINDLWGYFSVQPLYPNVCVVTMAAFVDLGSSLATLFERHIQDLILSTPLNLQRTLDQRPTELGTAR